MRNEARALQFYVRTNERLLWLPDTARGPVAQDVSLPLRPLYGIGFAVTSAIEEELRAL